MSPNTEPASTAASWSLSPNKINREWLGNASTNFANSAKSIMDASSTTTTSAINGFSRLWRKFTESGLLPNNLCKVEAVSGIVWIISSGIFNCRFCMRMASCILAAALPVGAANAIRKVPLACDCNAARMRTTVEVFPVPGPPDITQNRLSRATAAAVFCQSGFKFALWANKRFKSAVSFAKSMSSQI